MADRFQCWRCRSDKRAIGHGGAEATERLGSVQLIGKDAKIDKICDVAVIVGSLRKGSLNRQVANALAESAPAELKLNIVEIGADLQPGWR